ncbi:sulfate/molybdate ABC transporter ATP-binding protein [Phreatobacter sp.]|uniref:sulfate/molybdate ABC transporter ATP-binding protein n=1 Tax=Phreatobacter sp. TaxID=1966341 RepID=UPI003F70239F
MAEASGIAITLRQDHPIPLDVSLACATGEMVALVGPSGSGKTTTLRAIAGLYRPAGGLVRAGDAVWLDTAAGINLPPHLRRAGLVFQNHALFPHMTALGNVMAAMGHRPKMERREEALRLLALVDLHGLDGRFPAELSGGQQQRVAVARALAREPEILLLDEPFSSVDRRVKRTLHAELKALREAIAVPILLVTHDLDEAAGLADTMAVIDRGEIIQTGPPAELLRHPASARVAEALDLDLTDRAARPRRV